MFFRNLGLRMQFSHGSVVQEDQTIYIFFLFEMERKHSFSSTNRYWCERKLHFKILYLFSSVLFCFKNISNGQGNGALKK